MRTGSTKKKLILLAFGLIVCATVLFLLFGGEYLPKPDLSREDQAQMLTHIQEQTGGTNCTLVDRKTRAGTFIINEGETTSFNWDHPFVWRPKQAIVAFVSEKDRGRDVGAAVFEYDRRKKDWILLRLDYFEESDGVSVTQLLNYEDIWGRTVLLTTLEDADRVRYSHFKSGLLLMLTELGISSTPVESALTELDEGFFGSVNVFDAAGEVIWTTGTESGEPYPYDELKTEAIQNALTETGIEAEPELGAVRAFQEEDLYWEIVSWTSGNDMGFSLLSGEEAGEGMVYSHLESHLYQDFMIQQTPTLLLTYVIPNGEEPIEMNLILNAWDEVRELCFTPDVEGMEDFVFNTRLGSPGLEIEEGTGNFWLVTQNGTEMDIPDLDYVLSETIPGEAYITYIYNIQ